MAGGEFRLGTDSIYMANQCHNQNVKSTIISPITWLHSTGHFPGMQSNSNLYRFGKREVRTSPRHKIHNLREERPSHIHGQASDRKNRAPYRGFANLRSNRHQTKSATTRCYTTPIQHTPRA